MSLIRTFYDPFTDFDRLFDDAFTTRLFPPVATSNTTETGRALFRPRMDLHEDPDGVNVTATTRSTSTSSRTISGKTGPTQERDESGYKVERDQGPASATAPAHRHPVSAS